MNHSPASTSRHALARHVQRAAMVVALLLAGCGGAAVLFVPFFSFGFTGTVNNAGLSMFLKVSDDCSTEGALPASANLSVNGGGSSTITGTYKERDVMITLATPPAGFAAIYDGEFTDRDTLVFTPRGGGAAFTVRRNDVGAPLPTCPA